MLAYVTLLLASATSFPGGSADAFAKSIADATAKPVLVVSATRGQVAKFVFDPSSLEEIGYAVSSKTQFRKVGGSDYYFNEQRFVQTPFAKLLNNPKPGPGSSEKVPDGMIVDGKVTLDTSKGGAINLFALSKASGWGKPVTVDYLFQDLSISADVKSMPIMDFWFAVAKATGGALVKSDDGYQLAYDPSSLRSMLINTLTVPAPTSNTLDEQDVKRTFYLAIVQDLDDDALLGVFKAPGNISRFDVAPNSDPASAALTYIKQMAEVEGGDVEQSPQRGRYRRPTAQGSGTPAVQILEGRIDTRVPAHIRIGANGEISVSVPVIPRGSRKSMYIEV